MSPDRDSKKGEGPPFDEEDDGVDSERPTEIPPFDPVAFARDVLKPSPSPMKAITTGGAKQDVHTIVTPPHGTTSQGPATTPRPGEFRRKTPVSTLSLANARIPSNLPPRMPPSAPAAQKPPPPLEEEPMNPLDQEWADLELATRPPPADGPAEDPVLEIGSDRHPPLDLDEVELMPPSGGKPPDLIDSEEQAADTVRRPVQQEAVKSRAQEMNDRISLGDYSGALDIAERILLDNPNDAEARACAESCRTVLRQMYATRIGPLDRVPVVMVPRDQLRWLSIDHKAGFVLSLVDGVSSLEMIIDVSGMPELDTLRILSELAQQRIISLR